MDQRLQNDVYSFSDTELSAMQKLRQRMTEYSMICFQTDDRFLSKYLRFHDLDIEKSLEMIIHVYKLKKKYPDWYASCSVNDYMRLLRENHRYMLPKRDKNGRRVFIYKLGNALPNTTIFDVAQLDDMWYEAMLTEYETQINGITIIIDCKHLPWSCLKWCHPKFVRIGAEKSDMLAVKELHVHVVNTASLLPTVVHAVLPFLSKNFRERFNFYQSQVNWEKLHAAIGKDCLPPEYGGPPEQEVDYDAVYRYLLDFDEFLMANRKFGYIK